MRTPSSFLRESLRSSPGHPQSVCPIREERDYVSTISGYSSASTPHRGMDYVVQDEDQDDVLRGPINGSINDVINGVIRGPKKGSINGTKTGSINGSISGS